MTSPLTYFTNGIQEFVKGCIKSWVHRDFRSINMLFGRLQPMHLTYKLCTAVMRHGIF